MRAAALALLVVMTACGGASHSYDCNTVCNLYKNCYDADYDTKDCETNCENMSGASTDYGQKASDCHVCMGSGTCPDPDAGTFTCAETCTGVVP